MTSRCPGASEAGRDGRSAEEPAAAITGPDRAAVILDDQLLTHRDLDRAIGRFAGVLSAMGVAAGDRDSLHLPNVPAFPVGEADELLVRGQFVMAGCWNRPVASAEATDQVLHGHPDPDADQTTACMPPPALTSTHCSTSIFGQAVG
ncbi:AMP-binding protein [Streptacidiphilus sp. PAMC 29251]